MERRSFVLSALFAPFYLRNKKGFKAFRILDLDMLALPAVAGHPPLRMTDTIQPPDEPCPRPSIGIAPPARFVQAMSESRLIAPLREAAKLADPDQLLTRSAIAFYIAGSPDLTQARKDQLARDNGLSFPQVVIDEAFANALADLAVTGRRAYERFKMVHPKPETILPLVKQRLGIPATSNPILTAPQARPNIALNSGPQRPTPPPRSSGGLADVDSCVNKALDRAYQVAHALRGSYTKYAEARKPLGWIAVSGEDDPPHRPVNMDPLPYPQYEIPVTLRGVTIDTRFYIASANTPALPPTPTFQSSRIPTTKAGMQINSSVLMPYSLPADETPVVPQGHRVILFIHGHSSNAEEAAIIIPQLLAAGKARGINYSVITFDLPNNGYSKKFDHLAVQGLNSNATTFPGGIFDNGPINTPVLDFIEEFIVAFVDRLDAIAHIKNRFAGVIGGSLGGNMGLRLGRRNPGSNPWLANGIVSWSPASVWSPMVKDETKRHAPEHCRDKWNESELPASRNNYFAEVYDGAMFNGQGRKDSPGAFMEAVVGGGHTQPDMWWSSKWACKQDSIKQSHIGRHEIYHEHFRRWHWRVAGEQLIFSHIAQVRFEQGESPQNPYRYLLNRIPLLLASGADDDYPFTGIYSATRSMAQKMTNTPGTTLFLKNTGHSIHDERPRYLASKIVEFLG